MKLFFVIILILVTSCNSKKVKYFTAEVEFTCTPTLYFDTLSTFLLTNDKSDIGGRNKGISRLFNAERIYKKNVVKRNGHFYIDSIENSEYWLLLIECRLDDIGYYGLLRNLDFTKNNKDTLPISICVEPTVRIISQK